MLKLNEMNCDVVHIPAPGWEREATGQVESKTPTAASPVPGQTLGHNSDENPPVR